MRPWKVKLSTSARREYRSLPPQIRAEVRALLDELRESGPEPTGAPPLDRVRSTFRVAVHPFRIVYQVGCSRRIIFVTRIRHRRNVYEGYFRNPLWIPNPAVRAGRRPVELLTDRAKRYRYRPPSAVLIHSLSRSVQRLGEQRHRRHRADHQCGQHPWCDCSFPVHRNGDHIGMPLFPENMVTSHYMAHLESQFLKGLDCLTTRCGHLLSNRNNLFALDLGIGSRSPSSSVVSR